MFTQIARDSQNQYCVSLGKWGLTRNNLKSIQCIVNTPNSMLESSQEL
jgi:hypothetical protein